MLDIVCSIHAIFLYIGAVGTALLCLVRPDDSKGGVEMLVFRTKAVQTGCLRAQMHLEWLAPRLRRGS